ncbi:MAG: hypothetical protein AAF686_08045 [Pseudomonadota bacterium]
MYLAPMQLKTSTPTTRLENLWLHVGSKVLSARVQVPAQLNPELAPLLALHGISRRSSKILAEFGPECERQGRILIVPRFGRKHWSHFQTIDRHRPDIALLTLIAHLEQAGVISTPRISLFGFSGGAQLAHRFAMLYPHRIASLHVAAAGWYCAPDKDQSFPRGLGQPAHPTGFNPASLAVLQLPAFLQLPIHVYVGCADTEKEAALRQGLALETHQGATRLARARSYIGSLQQAAEARGIAPDLNYAELPGCGHDFSACAQAGMTPLVCSR